MLEFVGNYWLTFLFGIITTIIGIGYKKLKNKIVKQHCENISIKNGVQALLRDRILQSYDKYMELQYYPITARENMDHMSEEYFNLGGNGMVKDLLEKLNELPTKKAS